MEKRTGAGARNAWMTRRKTDLSRGLCGIALSVMGLPLSLEGQESFFRRFEEQYNRSLDMDIDQRRLEGFIEAGNRWNSFQQVGLEFNYDNNITNLPDGERDFDWSISPRANFSAVWAPNESERVQVNFGTRYRHFLRGKRSDALFISDGSFVEYSKVWGQTSLVVRDNIVATDDPGTLPDVAGFAQFGGIRNTASMNLNRRFGAGFGSLGYNHFNFWSTQAASEIRERASDTLSGSLGYNVSRYLVTGVRASFTDTRNKLNIFNDSQNISGSGFIEAKLTPSVSLNGSVGMTQFTFDSDGAVGPSPNSNNLFYALNLSQDLTENARHSVNVSRSSQLGFNADLTQRFNIGYQISLIALDNVSFGLSIRYTDLQNEVGVLFSEDTQSWDLSPSIQWALNDRSSLRFTYRYLKRFSTLASREFSRSSFTMDYSYSF